MHIQLLHTSASLAINENWDPDVRDDMEMMLNRIVPEDVPFRHSCEGPDDMVSNKHIIPIYFTNIQGGRNRPPPLELGIYRVKISKISKISFFLLFGPLLGKNRSQGPVNLT